LDSLHVVEKDKVSEEGEGMETHLVQSLKSGKQQGKQNRRRTANSLGIASV
jgi:hypothetical protein